MLVSCPTVPHRIGKDELIIIDLRLAEVRQLLADRKIDLRFTDSAKELLLTKGCDPNYGARPLKRAVQGFVQDALSRKILHGEVRDGDEVTAKAEEGELRFRISGRKRARREPEEAW